MLPCGAGFYNKVIYLVLQTEFEIQLKVWKDLAISKQVLIGAATKALGLKAECSTEDLRSALTGAIKRAEEADANIARMREQTAKELAEMKAQVETIEKALAEAQKQTVEATNAHEAAERKAVIGKRENTEALKKSKAEVADKQNQLKAISKVLSDTPENVVKKLKALKKQKFDEAKIRTLTETQLRNSRKEKGSLERDIEDKKAKLESIAPVTESLREMRELCEQANEKIKSLSEDEKDLVKIPELDEELLRSLVAATPDQ